MLELNGKKYKLVEETLKEETTQTYKVGDVFIDQRDGDKYLLSQFPNADSVIWVGFIRISETNK